MLPAVLSAAGSVADHLLGKQAANKQYKQQKEFAQSGIQWRVADAEKAGIHPLYALGAQTTSYSPVSVGGGNFAEAGQNIGRAIDATRSNPAKADALAHTASRIQLEGLQLDNEIKRAQLASAIALTRQSSNPGLPSVLTSADVMGMPGQGDAPQIDKFTAPEMLTSVREHGERKGIDPNWSNAQTIQDRYGDTTEEFYGVLNWFADKLHQRQQHFDKNQRPYIKLNPPRQQGGHRR